MANLVSHLNMSKCQSVTCTTSSQQAHARAHATLATSAAHHAALLSHHSALLRIHTSLLRVHARLWVAASCGIMHRNRISV